MTNIKVKVRSDNFYYWKKIETGIEELPEIKYLLNIVKKGDIILDIGAHRGSYTLLFSKLVGNNGKIYSFEPDIKSFRNLYQNIMKNKLNNVKVENIGLSNFIGQNKLYLYKGGGQSISSLMLFNHETKLNYIDIQLDTIDNYCTKNSIHPDGIKIDVEGSESLVIEGGQNILRKFHPWILLEFHGHFMTEKQRISNWQNISKYAKKKIFIHGESKKYDFGKEIKDIHDCNKFYAFIQY